MTTFDPDCCNVCAAKNREGVTMTDKLTWAEFTEKYKAKDGDKFTDDRGNEWVFSKEVRGFEHEKDGNRLVARNYDYVWTQMTCPLIPPKQVRKLSPALVEDQNGYFVSGRLFENERDASHFYNEQLRRWPAVPNADGSYTVPE